MFPRQVVDGPRLGPAAHARRLDVEDVARSQGHGRAGVVQRGDALVQAEGRGDLRAQPAVIVDVLIAERLLQHEQVERVERLQRGGVGQSVGRVGVEHQRDVRELGAHGPRQLHVVARLDLQLDAPVALLQVAGNDVYRLGEARLDADADADLDALARPFRVGERQLLGEGEAVALGRQIPDRLLQRRLGQRVAAHEAEARRDLLRLVQLCAEQGRDEEILEDVPRCVHRLVAVAGVVGGHALAPALQPVRVDGDDDGVALLLGAKAGHERRDEHLADVIEVDRFDAHNGFAHSQACW
mgnify:CR=1 FL=1